MSSPSSPTRLACLTVPLFPLASRLRSEPELREEAVVVFEGNGNSASVAAATRAARRAGIRPGMTLPQARALVPRLIARPRDPQGERTAREALLEAAELFSPRVEDASAGVAYLDALGLARHFKTERDLAQALLVACGRAGLPARIGLAGNKLAARIAAELPRTPTVVPEGGEPAFLSPLPLRLLFEGHESATPELRETLSRWGLRTIGALAKLSAAGVASRLGEEGHALLEAARGVDSRPLVPRHPPPVLSEGLELEWPLLTLEPFLAMTQGALERLTERLVSQGLGCARLTVTLRLDPEGEDVREFLLPAPTRDVKMLQELLRLNLSGKPPGAPVVGFFLTAHPDRPRRSQLTLFGPAEVSPDALAIVLARLLALIGEGRFGSPRTVDGYLPERMSVAAYHPTPPPLVRRPERKGRGLLGVRVLRPPVELEVLVEEEERRPFLRAVTTDGDIGDRPAPRPAFRITSLRSLPNQGGQSVSGPVRVASGPWSLEEGWWSEAPARREYWDVEMAAGPLYRIYQERATERWFLDGIYD